MEGPVNILIIENGVGPSGAYKCALNLAEGLDKELFIPHIFIPADWPKYGEMPPGLSILPVRQTLFRYHRSAFKFIVNFFLGVVPFIVRTFLYCRKHNIRLIHLNNDLHCNYNGVLAAMLLRVPCISHTRGTMYDSPFIRFLAKHVTLFIAVSDYVKKSELNKIGVDEKKIKVIYDGYRTDKYDPEIDDAIQRKEFDVSRRTLTVGMASMLLEWKGHKTFLKAAQKVLKETPDCRFFIIGDTAGEDKRYRDELVALAEDLGIREDVVFTGYRDDIPQMLKMLDVVVHAATLPDPLPGAVLQPMAMTKPVVASRCGGVPEMIEDGENGMLFEPGDAGALKNILIDLLKNEEKRDKLGQKARERFLENFTLDKTITRTSEIYEQVLSSEDEPRKKEIM